MQVSAHNLKCTLRRVLTNIYSYITTSQQKYRTLPSYWKVPSCPIAVSPPFNPLPYAITNLIAITTDQLCLFQNFIYIIYNHIYNKYIYIITMTQCLLFCVWLLLLRILLLRFHPCCFLCQWFVLFIKLSNCPLQNAS